MKIAVLFQAYNRLDYTKVALERLIEWMDFNCKLVIADNGSTDGTTEYLKELEKSRKIPRAEFIYYEKNYGRDRPRCHFILTHYLKYDYLGYVANDVLISPNWVSDFSNLMEETPSIGIVGGVDRDWGDRELVNKNSSLNYYSGQHFYFSDGYWLLRSKVVGEIKKKVKLDLKNGKEAPHPGAFQFNLISGSQEWYWDSIREAGFETACHPDHKVQFTYGPLNPNSSGWHRSYELLNKVVYCTDPERYQRDSEGLVHFWNKDQKEAWMDEPFYCRFATQEILDASKKKGLAQLDFQPSESEIRKLKDGAK